MSPFIDHVTHKKIMFVNKGDKAEAQLMGQHFELDQLEPCMGGTGSDSIFSVQEYRLRCLKEDVEVAQAVQALTAGGAAGKGSASVGSNLSEMTVVATN